MEHMLDLIKEDNDYDLFIYLLELRDKSQLNKLEDVDKFGNTLLLNCCRWGRLQTIQVLRMFDASINAINYKGQNALTLATYGGHFDVIRYLLQHRSYEDFNESSITPAICVAALTKNNKLLNYLKKLSNNSHNIRTVHGSNYLDILEMHAAKDAKEHKQDTSKKV